MDDRLEHIVRMDQHDHEVRTAPKLEGYRHGPLHRILSVTVRDRLLPQ